MWNMKEGTYKLAVLDSAQYDAAQLDTRRGLQTVWQRRSIAKGYGAQKQARGSDDCGSFMVTLLFSDDYACANGGAPTVPGCLTPFLHPGDVGGGCGWKL